MAIERNRLNASATDVFGSPERNVAIAASFVLLVSFVAVIAYMIAGWNLSDALYMVVLTIFTVGYGEVRPIDTGTLRLITGLTIALGCTGMIVLTGALVQLLTVLQLRRFLGFDRMQSQIEHLREHTVVCGFGRIGVQLCSELKAARAAFVLVERSPEKVAEAQALGYLCVIGEATDEATLRSAGIERAKVIATVLPDDATNVFITLSARSLNPDIHIIARGEAPTTENKLYHAGADKVVLPTHIGAERIAEIILYPASESYFAQSGPMRTMKRDLHDLGLELEVVRVAEGGALTGATVGSAEQHGRGGFFVVQIERTDGVVIQHPGDDVKIESGDAVVLLVRGSRISAGALFTAPAEPLRTGRNFF
ncbi:MAG: NAD-binding protein [Sphingomonadales bacterium]|nr:NAD-binding protein [Sphingomonadales bacterium]MDE2570380.1 NAD-binding protein [Sphingomonadales bacterium]